MATIPIIQLLRNNNIYSTRDAARSALEGQKNNVPDGGVILARYSGTTGEQMIIKTLAGFVSNISTSENATVTIIDVEGASENVQDAITSAINKLNKEDNAVYGQYVSSVSEENGIIRVTRTPLPSVKKSVVVGEAVTAVTQTDGEIGVEYGSINANNVSVRDSMNRFDSDNVEDVLFEINDSISEAMRGVGTMIDGKINAINSAKSGTSQHITVGVTQTHGEITLVTVQEDNIASASLLGTTSDTKDNETAFGRIAKEVDERTAAIEAMSLSPVSGTGKVITAITQTNGVVNATADTLSASSVAFSSPNFTASTNVNDALETLYTRSGDGSKVTLDDAEGSEGSNVLKVYTIKQGDREVGTINIPKDLVVTSGSVVKGNWNDGVFTENVSGSGTALKLVIANQTNPVYINTLDLVKDHTGGNGISISDTNEISVVRDSNSEGFLTVSESGVKLSGVQAAINKANTKVAKDSGADKITLSDSTAADGSVTYTIGQKDIASEAALTAEVNDRQSADTTLQNNIDNVNSTLTTHTADNVVHITQAEREKWNTPTDLSNYYTKTEVDSKVNDINSTIESYGQVTSQALNDLGTRLDDYGKVTSQSLNDLSTKFGDYYTKSEVDEAIANVDITGQLQNYYTKAEVDSKDSTIQTALDALSGDTKTKIDAEVAARVSGDNALQTALDALDAHVSENEDIVSQSLNDLNNRIGNTYVKSYIDALEARIAELETKFLNMENNGLQAGEY